MRAEVGQTVAEHCELLTFRDMAAALAARFLRDADLADLLRRLARRAAERAELGTRHFHGSVRRLPLHRAIARRAPAAVRARHSRSRVFVDVKGKALRRGTLRTS